MAKVDVNTALGSIHGTMDGYVYRGYRRRALNQMYRKPRPPAQWSAGTLGTRSVFSAASDYFKRIKDDAELVARYRKAGRREGINCRHRAMRDYYNPPEIHDIDLAKYRVETGGPIVVWASDDFEVTRVHVALDDEAGNIVLQGEAALRSGLWYFDAPPAEPGASMPVNVAVTAYDRPGNVTIKNFPLLHPTNPALRAQ